MRSRISSADSNFSMPTGMNDTDSGMISSTSAFRTTRTAPPGSASVISSSSGGPIFATTAGLHGP